MMVYFLELSCRLPCTLSQHFFFLLNHPLMEPRFPTKHDIANAHLIFSLIILCQVVHERATHGSGAISPPSKWNALHNLAGWVEGEKEEWRTEGIEYWVLFTGFHTRKPQQRQPLNEQQEMWNHMCTTELRTTKTKTEKGNRHRWRRDGNKHGEKHSSSLVSANGHHSSHHCLSGSIVLSFTAGC